MTESSLSLVDERSEENGPGDVKRDAFRAGGAEMAVAGLVLSVLWLFFLGSIAGLWLGLAARRQLAAEGAANGPPPAPWAGKLANAAVVIGGLGTAFGVLLGVLQLLGVLDITAACHPAVQGDICRLIVR